MKRHHTMVLAIIVLLLSTMTQAQEIIEAAKAGDLARVRELVESTPRLVDTIDETGRSPLHWAARGVHAEVMSYLIGKGADVNLQDGNLVTPLISVCSRSHLEAARVLLDIGADPGVAMFEQSTPLHISVSSGNTELVALLLEYRAPLHCKDSREDTPLHAAAHLGKWDVVDTIVSRIQMPTAEVLTSVDFDGNTILHLACRAGRMPTVKAIASKQVDINIRNTRGQTAYNMAVGEGFTEIADFLVGKGAGTKQPELPQLRGPYLGQTPPDTTPRLFAKGIVSTRIGMYGTIVFSPDGREAFWKTETPEMLFMQMDDDVWGAPRVFPSENTINVPLYSIDGDRLYVMTKQQDQEEIWYFTKRDGDWIDPKPLDSAINARSMHWQFSVDQNGDLYFSGSSILCARFINGEYLSPEPLPSPINRSSDSQEQYREGLVGPCISADGDFLIFTKFSADRQNPVQLYVTFRDGDELWTEPQNLSDKLQTAGNDSSARISPDGKYMFFQSVRQGSGASRGVYWVSTEVIDELRPGQ